MEAMVAPLSVLQQPLKQLPAPGRLKFVIWIFRNSSYICIYYTTYEIGLYSMWNTHIIIIMYVVDGHALLCCDLSRWWISNSRRRHLFTTGE